MLHVLVVDDIKLDRLIMKKELGAQYHVTTLSSAAEALAFSRSDAFDVALINVMLREDLDGIELLHDLRKIHDRHFLALAISCHLDIGRILKLTRAGFGATLQKPLDLNMFAYIVSAHRQQYLEEQQQQFSGLTL